MFAQALFNSASPTVLGRFTQALGDYDTLSTLSSMPTGGSVSRAGQAMMYDSTGKLTWAPNNLCTYSQTLSNSVWQSALLGATLSSNETAPDGSSTAGKLAANSGTDAVRYCGTGASSASVGTFTFSIYAKAGEFSWFFLDVYSGPELKVWFNLSNGTKGTISGGSATYDMISVGNGWYRCYVTFTSSISSITARLASGNGSSTSGVTTSGNGIYLWGAQLELVTYQTTPSTYVATTTAAYYGPRFDYYYDTGTSTWKPKGLLVEGTRTNLVLQSGAMTNAAWSVVTGTMVTDTTVASDGVTLMGKITNASGSSGVQFYTTSTVSITANATYTCSCEVMAGTNNYPTLCLQGDGTNWATATFDISTTSNLSLIHI